MGSTLRGGDRSRCLPPSGAASGMAGSGREALALGLRYTAVPIGGSSGPRTKPHVSSTAAAISFLCPMDNSGPQTKTRHCCFAPHGRKDEGRIPASSSLSKPPLPPKLIVPCPPPNKSIPALSSAAALLQHCSNHKDSKIQSDFKLHQINLIRSDIK